MENGTKITSPCSLVNKQASDEAKAWVLTTLDPKRKHSSEGGEELAPAQMPRPEGFPAEGETFYVPKAEGEEFPTEEGCEPLAAELGSVVEGNELAVYEPGPYILEQLDFKAHWELRKTAPTPQKCGNNDQYYPEASPALEPPETEPPEEYSWDITSYCNTVNSIKFNMLGGEGMCTGEKQDMSLFPEVPYFNQYDTGSRLNLPVSSSRKGGNACGPSSLLMAMRWNIDATAARDGWSPEELVDATKGLPSMYAAYDATMLHTRATQGKKSNHFVWEPKALRYVRSLGWSQARVICLGTSEYIKKKKETRCNSTLLDVGAGNQQKITEALTEGPILISTALSTRRWGLTGGGHVIMVFGFDSKDPEDVDVYDPAGNYFSTPKSHYADTPKGGHYGPSSCGYDVPYPLSWLLAYTTGRVFMRLGPAPAADPPLIGISDAEPGTPTAPEDFYLQNSDGQRSGWVEGEPVEEIPGAFVGQSQESFTDPGFEDAELEEEPVLPEEPIGASPRSISMDSPPPGTTLHVSSSEGGSFALDAEQWGDGEVVSNEDLSGSLQPGKDQVVSSPALDAAIASSQQPTPGVPSGGVKPPIPVPPPARKENPVATAGKGIAVASHVAQVRAGRALLKMRCQGTQPCRGQVELLDPALIGKARFKIAAGKSSTVAVTLNGVGRRLLLNNSQPSKVTLAGSGLKRTTVVLKPAKMP